MEDDNRKLYPMLMLPVDPKRSGDERYTLADLGAVDTMVDNGWLGGNSMGEIMETYLDRVSGEIRFFREDRSVVHQFRRPGGEGLHGFQGRRIRRRALSKMPDGRCPLPSQRD